MLCRACVDCGLMTGGFVMEFRWLAMRRCKEFFALLKTVYLTRNGLWVRVRRCAALARSCMGSATSVVRCHGALLHRGPKDHLRLANDSDLLASVNSCFGGNIFRHFPWRIMFFFNRTDSWLLASTLLNFSSVSLRSSWRCWSGATWALWIETLSFLTFCCNLILRHLCLMAWMLGVSVCIVWHVLSSVVR